MNVKSNNETIKEKAIKAGFIYTVAAFLAKGMTFITMPVFSRLLSTAEVGEFSNFVSWITILLVLTTFSLESSINVAYFDYKEEINEYMSTMLILGSFITLLFYVISLPFSAQLSKLFGMSDYMINIMFMYFFVSPSILVLSTTLKIKLHYRPAVLLSIFPSLAAILVSLLFVLLSTEEQLKGRIVGYYGTLTLVSVITYIYVLSNGRKLRFQYIPYALQISAPLVLHQLSNTILASSDRVMINYFCDSSYTGLYSIAYSCAMVIALLWNSINEAWTPFCYNMMYENREGEVFASARYLVVAYCIVAFILILLAPEILYIMGGKVYVEAKYVISPVVVGYVARMLYTFYVNIEFYYKKQFQIMIGTFVSALVNVGLNLVFIPRFGYIAAAYTTLVSYIILLFVHYFFVRKMKKAYMYNMKFFIVVLGIMLFAGLAVNVLYGFNIVRWIIIVFIVLFFLKYIAFNYEELSSAIREKNIMKIIKLMDSKKRKKNV